MMGTLTQEPVVARDVVLVALAGPGPATDADGWLVADLFARWAEKYPDVPVAVDIRRRIDAAVTLVAATRGCAVALVGGAPDPPSAAVLDAMLRRAHCPVVVAGA